MRRGTLLTLLTLWTLACGCNPTHPRVETVSPAVDETIDVQRPMITITFDREMNPKTFDRGHFYTVGSVSGLVYGTITFASGYRTAKLKPSRSYAPGESVTVILTNDIRSRSGKFNRGRAWEFHVSPDAIPSALLVATDPPIEGVLSGPSLSISLIYSTPIDPGSVTSGAVRID
ncbi:MAG: Ig-like domain-containing protein, partial [Planctomycetes bacterium]|nr:Ig-like domain-containing protein [Planctomycetota bacterium]